MYSFLWLGLWFLHASARSSVPLIIDTDFGGGACHDIDDAAAVALGNALADNGEVDLVAVLHNTAGKGETPLCVGGISVINHYYGRDDVPIGAYKGDALPTALLLRYVKTLVENFPSPIRNSSQVPDAVEVYRKALAAQADSSTVIASIGLSTNLAGLLKSGPDEHSSLNGTELVIKKVKLLAMMAGHYDDPNWPYGPECNMQAGPGYKEGAPFSSFVVNNWPPSVRMTFVGAMQGWWVRSGRGLQTCVPPNNPLRQAFLSSTFDVETGRTGPWQVNPVDGRSSWDPLTVLAAIRGPEAVGAAECTNCDGTNHVDPTTGDNTWIPGKKSNQSYLLMHDVGKAQEAIDKLLCQLPRNPPPEPTPTPLPGTCLLKVGKTYGKFDGHYPGWALAAHTPGSGHDEGTGNVSLGPTGFGYGGGTYEAAWDGYAYSFYDYGNSDGGWTSGALEKNAVIAAIQYYPRRGYPNRSLGGEFLGVTENGDTISLANISALPSEGWNTLQVEANKTFVNVTYRGAEGSYGNIAEIKLYEKCGSEVEAISDKVLKIAGEALTSLTSRKHDHDL